MRWIRSPTPKSGEPYAEAAFLDEERASLGDLAFRQEYLCEFADAKEQIISTELRSNVLTEDFSPWSRARKQAVVTPDLLASQSGGLLQALYRCKRQ